MENRRQIQGVVVSNKADKTIIIQVESYRKHPKYKKRVQVRSKYVAHDELNEANVGDVVTIQECRPMSATKRYRLVAINKKALETVEVKEEEAVEEVLHEEKQEAKEEE